MKHARIFLGINIFWLPLSMLFDGINALVLPTHISGLTDEGSRASTLGLLTFTGILLGMIVQPVAGAWSDRVRPRWGRHGVIGLGAALMLVALLGLGLSESLIAVVFSYLALQAAASVAQAAQQALIPDLVPSARRGMAAGIKGMLDLAGATVAFLVLGQLLAGGSIRPALLVLAGVIVLAFAIALFLVREPGQPASVQLPRITLAQAFRLDLRSHRGFCWVVASRFLFLLGTYAVGRFLLYFVADRLGLDPARAPEEAGMLLGSLALLTALAAPIMGWAADRLGRLPLMYVGAVLSAVGALLLIVASTMLHLLLSGGLMALGSAAFAGANWALTADLAPPNQAARFLGLANIGTAGAAAAAGLFGPVVDWSNRLAAGSGYPVLFTAAACAFLASMVGTRRAAAFMPPGRAAPMPGATLEQADYTITRRIP